MRPNKVKYKLSHNPQTDVFDLLDERNAYDPFACPRCGAVFHFSDDGENCECAECGCEYQAGDNQ